MVDPTVELTGHELRDEIRAVLLTGRIRYTLHGKERMAERDITIPEVVACLRLGSLSTEGIGVRQAWTYRAESKEASVIFAFDVDGEGNVIVIITTMKPKKRRT